MSTTTSTSSAKRWIAVVLTALLLAVGLFGWWQHFDLNSGAAQNHAISDAKATGQVQSVVGQGLERVLSYDYQQPDATKQAAKVVLSGNASKEYDELFGKLQDKAPDQKLVLTARVIAAGVVELTDDKAKLLVFVDQSSRRAKDKDASVSAAQLSVTAQKNKGTWTITGLKPL